MKYHLITYGCQMNKSDSERIAGFLDELGGQAVAGPEEAELVILNTCSVRQSAENRVFGQVNNLVQLKRTNPGLIIAVTGCLPGRDQDEKLRKKMPGVDLFFPIIDLPKLPEMLEGGLSFPRKRESSKGSSFQNIDWIPDQVGNDNEEKSFWSIKPFYRSTYSAFIPIQTGCNNYCAYCVVPYARGPEKNRPLSDALVEIKNFVSQDGREIILLGQTINHYQAPDAESFSKKNPFLGAINRAPTETNFAALLWEINQIEGLARVDFTAAHPSFMSEEVIEALTLPKQVNYLHLAVQSGSDSVLKRMNRRYTAGEYLSLIEKIKKKKPGIALGTDIIVGFPGETEDDFQATVDLYKKADFDIAYLAQYSPRSGTAASHLPDDVLPEEKEQRWWVLQKLMEETTLRKNQAYLGRTVEVLVEKKTDEIYSGQSRERKLVEFEDNRDRTGKIVNVRIETAEMWRLRRKCQMGLTD